jgi:hypothetical protein
VVESEGNVSANEVQMCGKLFHFLIILTTSEFDQTHAGFTTESGESDHILPRQNLGLSRSDTWWPPRMYNSLRARTEI